MSLRATALVLAAMLAFGLVSAGAFWLAELAVGGMPSPWWGLVAGALLALASYLRTGWAERRRRRG